MTRNNFFLNVFSRNSRNLLRRSKKSPKSFNVRTLASQNDANSNIMHSESSDVDIPNVTIPEFILPSLERFEKYVASECATTGRTYTFGQIRGKSKNLNKALRHAFKLQKGDVVGILLPNCPEFGIAVLGVLEAGLTITTMNPIYTPVLFLISHSGVKSEYFDRLKMLMSAAAPLGLTDEERFIRKVRKEINMCQGYGLTEASPVITMIPNKTKRSEKNSGGVGKVLPNTLVKFINPEDPSGTPIAAYEKGELLMKGPQVMKGYHNREEETKKAFLDGWLRTGDIGYYNDENVVFITDRIKELIKVKGYQVAPAELEAIIRDHPLVDDAAVIGIPHPQHGEVPRAYVVPKKNSALDEENVQNHVADKVASYKRLQGGVRILESIPKNTTGKILRRQLKENFAEKGF
ncbi:unnamed protein product [Phyllotreta striolata]|uniref:Uncharacterized protein n=1 Tax=Phyllotreta striolata TaxID=444603 RepID=A0A9N9TT18_PHYSR|nr:unnamed protein product [Phyllotreta striolata]